MENEKNFNIIRQVEIYQESSSSHNSLIDFNQISYITSTKVLDRAEEDFVSIIFNSGYSIVAEGSLDHFSSMLITRENRAVFYPGRSRNIVEIISLCNKAGVPVRYEFSQSEGDHFHFGYFAEYKKLLEGQWLLYQSGKLRAITQAEYEDCKDSYSINRKNIRRIISKI